MASCDYYDIRIIISLKWKHLPSIWFFIIDISNKRDEGVFYKQIVFWEMRVFEISNCDENDSNSATSVCALFVHLHRTNERTILECSWTFGGSESVCLTFEIICLMIMLPKLFRSFFSILVLFASFWNFFVQNKREMYLKLKPVGFWIK